MDITITIHEKSDGSARVFMGDQYLGRLDPIAVSSVGMYQPSPLWEATDPSDISKPQLFDTRFQAALSLMARNSQ